MMRDNVLMILQIIDHRSVEGKGNAYSVIHQSSGIHAPPVRPLATILNHTMVFIGLASSDLPRKKLRFHKKGLQLTEGPKTSLVTNYPLLVVKHSKRYLSFICIIIHMQL